MRRRRPDPPLVSCVDCGREVATWSRLPRCFPCARRARRQAAAGVGSIRALVRARNGRCAVCGGPYQDGSGCEFCPRVGI